MKKWILKGSNEKTIPVAEKYKISPLLSKILLNRFNLDDVEKFLLNDDDLYSYKLLNDIDIALYKVSVAINGNKKIRIVGDYDVDGITATAILYRGLKFLGAICDYIVPDRVKDGYGINTNIVKQCKDDGIDLIITCDNGIAAIDALQYAKDIGLSVVLTDHHNIVIDSGNMILPVAEAIVNPKLSDNYPLKEISGAMVAYKFIIGLSKYMNKNLDNIGDLEVLSAIGTVCDVMPLISENRILVKNAVKKLNYTDIMGIKAIGKVFGLNLDNITSYSIGFVIGPAINSAGRLDDPMKAAELLITDDFEKAINIAEYLFELNKKRQAMTNEAIEEAIMEVEKIDIDKYPIVVLHLRNVHESLAGIIAGRIREKIYRPVLIFTGSNDKVKGSARSIMQYDLYKNLSEIKECFEKFGGHTLAAGFSTTEDMINIIREKLNKNSKLTKNDLIVNIEVESLLPFKYINVNLIKELEFLEPYGTMNEQPIFATQKVKVENFIKIGKNKEYLKLTLNDAGYKIDAVCFNKDEELQSIFMNEHDNIDILYKLGVNEWNNVITPQLIIEDARISKS